MSDPARENAHHERESFGSEREWAEWVRDYYRDVESYDWVDVADHWRGLESVFHRNRRRVVRDLLRTCQAQVPILDAGCGTGLNLASMPAGSVGIDLNPRNVALVQERLPQHHVVVGDIEQLPFGDAEFGTVVCTEVLEHVPHPDQALAEIHRVLRRGGQLIGSVPARSLIWRFRFLSSTCPRDEPFHHEYRPEEVAEMLHDFDGVRVWFSALRFNVLFVARRD
jgi:2-polyprenyl-3-methyl-5-hydroxy-6-metoxy-1,4-benzoquinol methylase